MKKYLLKILISVLAVCFAVTAFTACGGNTWKSSDVTLPVDGAGSVYEESLGGFVAETENYVYYINGLGVSTDNNAFGVPIKGSLMAADKNDLSKKCIVVPKLFVASDYKAGVYIFDGYVYYGTPSTDKNTKGQIANNELQFMRTKLDGSSTDVFFKADSISTEYRIVKGSDNVIYIVYYDVTSSSLKSFNTTNKTTLDLFNTDSTNEENETLNAYKFFGNEGVKDAVVVFTTTVYTEAYSKEDAEANTSYARPTAKYNNVYAYKVGEEKPIKVLSGEEDDVKYEFTQITKEYLFFTVTDNKTTISKTYGITANDLYSENSATEIVNKEKLSGSALIVDFGEVYVVDGSYIKKTALTGDLKLVEKKVATGSFGTLLFKEGDYVYFYSTDNKLARIYIGEEEREGALSMIQYVSDQTVSSSWFAPEYVDGKVFYLDNSSYGANNVKCVQIEGKEAIPFYCEDDPKGEEIDYYYFENQVMMGKLTEQDEASILSAEISGLTTCCDSNGRLVMDVDTDDDGVNDNVQKIIDVSKKFDDFANKGLISEENKLSLRNYKEAVVLSNTLRPLTDFDKARSDDAKNEFKSAYETAKAYVEKLKTSSDVNYSTVTTLCEGNMRFYYQQAKAFFDPETK